MTVDDAIKQMRDLRYEKDIDVVDAVMAEVGHTPLLAPAPSKSFFKSPVWKYVAVAACVAFILVSVSVVPTLFNRYDAAQMETFFAEVYDYNVGDSYSPVCQEMDVATFLLDE